MSKRKLLSLFLAVLFIAGTVFAAGFRTGPSGAGEILGQGKYPSDPHRIYRLVRYVATDATLVAESIVVWDTSSDDGVSITTTTLSSDSTVAGIIDQEALTPDVVDNEASADIGRDNWTWLQTYGKAEVRIDASAGVTVGFAMGTAPPAGEATGFLPSTTSSFEQGNAGFFLDTCAAAADDCECFLVLD